MKVEEFLYWLQGYFELGGNQLNKQQLDIINEHLLLLSDTVNYKSEELEFLHTLLTWSNRRRQELKFMENVTQREIDSLREALQKQFLKVTCKDKRPDDGYEPLGDIYDNQRIC